MKKDLIVVYLVINFFDCEIRVYYVKSVYRSMSGDSEGGFEF